MDGGDWGILAAAGLLIVLIVVAAHWGDNWPNGPTAA